MAVIIRIDVDRPYGKQPFGRHFLSRCASDFYFPRIDAFGYLRELAEMLGILNAVGASAYTFFRRCTLPSEEVCGLIAAGRHEIGLHLENSRSMETFEGEQRILENHVGRRISSFSKHGSGGARFGRHHYYPYEPERYLGWATEKEMKVFFGNLENPELEPSSNSGTTFYPSAFWLEPAWRDIIKFPVEWLMHHARERDVVLLVHPENVLADEKLLASFRTIVSSIPSKIIQ